MLIGLPDTIWFPENAYLSSLDPSALDRTALDLGLHALMLITLVAGLIIAIQSKTRAVEA